MRAVADARGRGRSPGRHCQWGGTLAKHGPVKYYTIGGGKNVTCPERHVLLVRQSLGGRSCSSFLVAVVAVGEFFLHINWLGAFSPPVLRVAHAPVAHNAVSFQQWCDYIQRFPGLIFVWRPLKLVRNAMFFSMKPALLIFSSSKVSFKTSYSCRYRFLMN